MRTSFPTIRHRFDPWHYFRNLFQSLQKVRNKRVILDNSALCKYQKENLQICTPSYMTRVRDFSRLIINKAYWAATTCDQIGQGDDI